VSELLEYRKKSHKLPTVPTARLNLKLLISGTICTFHFQVCFKGPNIFKGYLYDDQKTKEAFDEDGWLLSGDIGIWLPNGTLKIVDRRKNIFKLSQVWARYV
jgi:acyl-CoA synthetase (AMP-forming)/AMP-acid ligase II